MDYIEDIYKENNYPIDKKDFIELKKFSKSAIKDIEALFKIEKYLNEIDENNVSHSKTILQEVKDIEDSIENQKPEKYLIYPNYDAFLHKIESSDLSSEEKEALDKMIEKLSEIDLITALRTRRILLNK